MKVKVLGTGGALDKMPTAFILNDHVLVDCGIEVVKKIIHSKEIESITDIFITHIHSDHISGLELIFYYFLYEIDRKVNIYGPEEVKKYFQSLAIAKEEKNVFTFQKIENFSIKGVKATYKEVIHMQGKIEAYAYIFEENKFKVIFTGDIDSPFDLSEYNLENILVFHDMGYTGLENSKYPKNHTSEKEVYDKYGDYNSIVGVHISKQLNYFYKAVENDIFILGAP